MALLSTFLLISLLVSFAVSEDGRKVCIVYMGALPPGDEYSPSQNHDSILKQVLEDSSPSESLIHHYKRSFNGFAAKLTDKEIQKLASMEDVVSVFPSKTHNLFTTRSWDFLGLSEHVKRVPPIESDVIIGMLDSGVWPESESFSDKGFSPPPKKWKGECNGGVNFTCNNKLIGARTYGCSSARDEGEDAGHGTHTASTAAGVRVTNVSFYGLAQGTARGGVPSARIAVYKVCSEMGCEDENILAAFDDAISDGVDILSVSLGPSGATDYLKDTFAIGSFHALEKGILTSQAAGNTGPVRGTVCSIAPWIVTVAASNMDRTFKTKVVLGDNKTLVGNAVNGFDTTKTLPLVDGWDGKSSEGKIVYYKGTAYGDENQSGLILQNEGNIGYSWGFPLPASTLSTTDGEAVFAYINRTRNPLARIFKSESVYDSSVPVVTSFSSRGPDPIHQDILKPDITAPGANIIAAWSPVGSPTDKDDSRSVTYNIMSGTSMSCPHVSGAAAYVKSFHPNWSPSAIKSSLLTTAIPLDVTSNPDAEFAYGAGQINPVRAVNPGLVYDATTTDYVHVLCGMYTPKQLKKMTGQRNTSCPEVPLPLKDLNYPTFVTFSPYASFKRTVTNVGGKNSSYKATVYAPPNVQVSVEPDVLEFGSLYESKSFVITVAATPEVDSRVKSGSLVWSDGIHSVRSPIAIQVQRQL